MIILTKHIIERGYQRLSINSDELIVFLSNAIEKGYKRNQLKKNSVVLSKVKKIESKNGITVRLYKDVIIIFKYWKNKKYNTFCYTAITFYKYNKLHRHLKINKI